MHPSAAAVDSWKGMEGGRSFLSSSTAGNLFAWPPPSLSLLSGKINSSNFILRKWTVTHPHKQMEMYEYHSGSAMRKNVLCAVSAVLPKQLFDDALCDAMLRTLRLSPPRNLEPIC